VSDTFNIKCINPECDVCLVVEMVPFKMQHAKCPACSTITSIKMSPHRYWPSEEAIQNFHPENQDSCSIIETRVVE